MLDDNFKEIEANVNLYFNAVHFSVSQVSTTTSTIRVKNSITTLCSFRPFARIHSFSSDSSMNDIANVLSFLIEYSCKKIEAEIGSYDIRRKWQLTSITEH